MSKKKNSINSIMGELTKCSNELSDLSKKTGTSTKVDKIREEISEFGWKHILQKYHPDVNIDDPAANELFQLYKCVYDDIKKNDK
ncbi:hypothetical protein RBH29_00435 [Herbivorax sp. ANBcel31]|uniref:hypothetical protein n=1 Tax=Herbivorax sp. ANBcel31 TaxID=3069754 RepID=UPI0027AEA753|nr:hypothetical protein [Herbivorax sp. ANBcel31]MDQ2084903.1 hypothetical protein [Herbivorax sp. ANBcel31]